MIQYLLEVSACTIGFIAFYYIALLYKNFHQLNRIYLIGTLLLSMAIPLIHIPIEEIVFVPEIAATSSQASIAETATSPITIIVISLYVFGCLYMFLKFVKEMIQIKSIISRSEKTKFPTYTLAELENEFPLCSFFNYIICERNTNISQFELNHELTHISQKHSYDKLFVELIKILLWFSPAIYLYQKSIHAVHEYLADESVVKIFGNDSYQNHLIHSVTNQQLKLSTLNPFYSLIKKRLQMLNNKKESTKTVFIITVPIIAGFIFFMSCEKTNKVVSLDQEEYEAITTTKDGLIEFQDTIVIFNNKSFEEEILIVQQIMSPEAYAQHREMSEAELTKYHQDRRMPLDENAISSNPYIGATGAVSPEAGVASQESAKGRAAEGLITVTDTIVVFDIETNEEEVKFVQTQITQEEYDKRIRNNKRTSKE